MHLNSPKWITAFLLNFFPFLCAFKQHIKKHKTMYLVPRDLKWNTYLLKISLSPAEFSINSEQKKNNIQNLSQNGIFHLQQSFLIKSIADNW